MEVAKISQRVPVYPSSAPPESSLQHHGPMPRARYSANPEAFFRADWVYDHFLGYLVGVVLCDFVTCTDSWSYHTVGIQSCPSTAAAVPHAGPWGSHPTLWFLPHHNFVILRSFCELKFIVLTNDHKWSYFNLDQFPQTVFQGMLSWCPVVCDLTHREGTISSASFSWDSRCMSAYESFRGPSWKRDLSALPNAAPFYLLPCFLYPAVILWTWAWERLI